ncbi:lipoate-protein ligase A [Scopulibacillus daqui]|uniref:Lipoate-protein ligase A n=1 Tax=Scopulibacillus daqui TaxID=1469162 RepID=A0ABS2PYJ4_9BACL|nr:biotin/lipoate A/B protein ligase family protein [Scopulibacillus daqui]MBM7645102.1 lipoate-protein ligase A [Scopulibacillus daqui]
MEKWLFIDSGINTPAFNMALDEALLDWHSQGLIPPAVRFYGWDPPGFSVGYFQKTKGKIDYEAVEKHGYELVRRPTGGRAVLHDNELTYSVIVSENHDMMPKSVSQAYRVISKGLLEGYKKLGIKAEFSIPEGKLGMTGSAVCFDEASWYELIVDGKKAAGSAQTRQKGVILQHGSIPISMDVEALFDCFIYPSDRVKQRALQSFINKAVSINDCAGRKVSLDEVKEAFYDGFKKGLDIEFEPCTLNNEQLAIVHDIAENKYLSQKWNYSR